MFTDFVIAFNYNVVCGKMSARTGARKTYEDKLVQGI